MADPTVTLRLSADNSRLVPVVRVSRDEVAALGKAATETGTAAGRGASGVARLGDASQQAGRSTAALTAVLNQARSAAAGLGAALAVRELVAMSDQYANITGRLKLATSSQQEFATAQAQVYAIAQRTSSSLESTATLYARLAQSTAEYGLSQQRQLALTETINRTFTISGASAEAAANTITQFNQSLAGGVLRAEEFNSVVENSPRLAKAMADGMGKSMGELRAAVNNGQVSVDKLVAALESQAGVIQREYEQMPLTVERAMVQMRNAITQLVGDASQQFGAGGALAEGISLLARNLGGLNQAVLVVAVAYGSKLAAGLMTATAEKAKAIIQTQALAKEELVAARAAEAQAAGRLALARAGIGAAGQLAAAEAAYAAAQARTATATAAASVGARALTAAQTALNAAMSAFGGPVGLAITALTLFVMWAANSRKEADQLAKTVTAGFQSAIDTMKGFSAATANMKFADLHTAVEELDNARKRVKLLQADYAEMAQQQAVAMTRIGYVSPESRKALADLGQQLEIAKTKQDQLTAANDHAIDVSADVVLAAAGITNATAAQRQSLETLLVKLSAEGTTLEQNKPHLIEWARESGNVQAANSLAAASFDKVAVAAQQSGAAIKAAVADVSGELAKQINQAQLGLIEKTQGKAAAMRAGLVKQLADKGIDPTSTAAKTLRDQNEQLIQLTLAQDKAAEATRNATKADSEAKQAAEKLQHTREQQLEAQQRYDDELRKVQATLDGPLITAQAEYDQHVVQIDRDLAKHNITQDTANKLKAAYAAELAKTTAELEKQQQAPEKLLASMASEIGLLGTLGIEHERYQRRLRAEEDMRQAVNEANKAGAKITADETAKLLAQARAYADWSLAVEEARADAQELADAATRGVADFADLWADTLSGGIHDAGDFFSELRDVFRKGWRDVLRTLLEQNLVRPIQNSLTSLLNGAFSAATSQGSLDWKSQLGSMIGGGAGLTATGNNTSWSATASAAAANPGSMMSFGNNLSAFSGYGSGSGMSSLLGGVNWGGALAGGLLGLQGGDSLLTKGLSTMSGALAGSALSGAVSAVSTAIKASGGLIATLKSGGSIVSALKGGWSALTSNPLGMIALGATVLDKVTGGGLFGTSYSATGGGTTLDIAADGGTASAYETQKKKKSLFRGTKTRTVSVAASDEAVQAASDIYDAVQQMAGSAADALGLATVDIISGSFKQVYDKKGNLTSQLATVLGQTYSESVEEFQKRLAAENIIAQIDQLDGSATGIAQRWRSDATKLLDGSQMLLQAAADINNGTALISQGGLSRITNLVSELATAGETLSEAYARIKAAAASYGATAAAAYQDVATAGFSSFAKSLLQVRQEEQQRIKTLQEQAKALGGLSAREEDLAKVREAAQLKTDALVTSLQSELVDLALNRINDQIQQLGGSADGAGSKITDFINSLKLSDTLSPDTDRQKRATAQDLMQSAAASGNVDSFISYAQQFLEVSRKLNASGAGYQTDYNGVLTLANQFGMGGGNAQSLSDLYTQRDALQAQQEAAARLERAQRIAQGVSDLAGVKGGDPMEILRNITGMSPADLAGDLGLTVDQLGQYLSQQQTDLGDLADILDSLPDRIATSIADVLANRDAPQTSASSGGTSTSSSGATTGTGDLAPGIPEGRSDQLLAEIKDGILTLVKRGDQQALLQL